MELKVSKKATMATTKKKNSKKEKPENTKEIPKNTEEKKNTKKEGKDNKNLQKNKKEKKIRSSLQKIKLRDVEEEEKAPKNSVSLYLILNSSVICDFELSADFSVFIASFD